jgi:hypothetical protein
MTGLSGENIQSLELLFVCLVRERFVMVGRQKGVTKISGAQLGYKIGFKLSGISQFG